MLRFKKQLTGTDGLPFFHLPLTAGDIAGFYPCPCICHPTSSSDYGAYGNLQAVQK